MASRKSLFSRPNYIFPATTESETNLNPEGELELDEADVWNISVNTMTEVKKGMQGSRSALKRASRKVDASGGGGGRVSHVASSSLPVNIPDWSMILKEDYKEHCKSDVIVGDDGDEGGVRIPPHEYLARTRGASHSVHEGIGRTLKGRDLRRVRNAIWKKVGFED